MLDFVVDKLYERGYKFKLMVFFYCIWDKFGDLLVNGGGRCLGLFDEMMLFFVIMNMYFLIKL